MNKLLMITVMRWFDQSNLTYLYWHLGLKALDPQVSTVSLRGMLLMTPGPWGKCRTW